MALSRYFKQHSNDKLPDPQGPLSIEVPLTSIVSANEEVRRVVSKEPAKRGPYAKLTAEQTAEIGKVSIRYYLDRQLALSHVSTSGLG